MLSVAGLALASAAACVEFEADLSEPDLDPDLPEVDGGPPGSGDAPAVPSGTGIGGECEDDGDCREGLVCEGGECIAAGDSAPGVGCTVSAECDDGQCINGQCTPAGDTAPGESCQSAAECPAGYRCGVVGLAFQCIPEGDTDALGECVSGNQCMAGLMCNGEQCVPAPNGAPGIPTPPPPLDCEEPTEGTVRAYFEVPGAEDADELDYFRLPFPNDVLTDANGRVNLDGFPTAGVNPLVGVDPIQLYVDAVDGTRGWGTNPTAVFRFSGRIDFASFDDNDAIHWLDITDPEEPINSGISFRTFSGDTNYICDNHFTIRRGNGFPMQPGHIYAVWLGTAGRGDNGLAIDRSSNFEAMLANATPSDSVLAAAHEKFAPFRAYLDANDDVEADDVLVATVITAGPVRDLMADLNDAVRNEPVPQISDWVLCGSGEDSPCPQAEDDRACGDGADGYDEYHALVTLPIFQEGEAPYIESGGGIDTSGPVRSEEICVSLTIPNGSMPDAGWPLVVFGHGTGGGFRSHIRDEVAGTLSLVDGLPDPPELPVPVDLDAGAPPAVNDGPVRFAVLGYDAVQHGPRRGDSDEHPNNLFFNFLNPDAAQGNPLQGAADIISIGRLASQLDVSAGDTSGDAIRIDPNAILFFGHSQGSIHANLALPYADEYKAAVLSGNGVSLIHSLLTKTEPDNIAAVVPFVVNDRGSNGLLAGEDHHPALSVVQQHIDPADGLNFAPLVREPLEGSPAKHVFQTYGLGDTYSPPITMEIYARAARLGVVEAHSSASSPDNIGPEIPAPLDASFGIEGVEYTTGVRQYGPPSGADGHFVVFDVPTANEDVARFLGMAARGQTPQIGD